MLLGVSVRYPALLCEQCSLLFALHSTVRPALRRIQCISLVHCSCASVGLARHSRYSGTHVICSAPTTPTRGAPWVPEQYQRWWGTGTRSDSRQAANHPRVISESQLIMVHSPHRSTVPEDTHRAVNRMSGHVSTVRPRGCRTGTVSPGKGHGRPRPGAHRPPWRPRSRSRRR